MSANNLSSVIKSCSDGELINDVSETSITPKQVEGSRLKRTFTLPRNPFGSSKPNTTKAKSATIDHSSGHGSLSSEAPESDTLERKLFRRPSWKRFLNKIAQHMSTVNVPGVKSPVPIVLNGERGLWSGEPPWPAGATPAATGIKNHGNTCYMNAVLQCLSHTDVIAEYFVLDYYKAVPATLYAVVVISLRKCRHCSQISGRKEWFMMSPPVDLQKRNKINSKKYGTKGEVTEQLATLLKALWACRYSPELSTAFKGAVDRHGSQYKGNSQHDAQEFLFWLLDKVHEDLNTATKKKYKTIKNTCGKPDEVVAAETLANHARRNSSFVQAVFQAQYRSALTCAKCARTSCTFDPFHCVSVQLPPRAAAPQPSPLPVNVVYVNQQPRQVRIGVELPPTATMDDLRAALHADTGIDKDHIILAEINETGWKAARGGWEPAGADAGALYCVEAPPLLPAPAAPYLLLLWVNVLDGQRFGPPYALQVPRETSYEDLQKLLLKEMAAVVAERALPTAQGADIFRARIAETHRPKDPAYLQPELPHPLYALGVEQALAAHDTHPQLRLELLWDPRHRDSIIMDPSDACSVHVSAPDAGAALTLHTCLAHYTRAERLAQEDAWRCPQCQRYMPVVKTLGLWSLPDVLVIHLKRFRQSKSRASAKLTTMVEFPLRDLDMAPHVARRRRAPPPDPYDLYAVCYHHGDDLETGHYTAACKNPYDGHWYKFDDSRVTAVEDDSAYSELVNNTAYMLFYRRRHASGSPADPPAGHWALRMPPPPAAALPEVTEVTEVTEVNGREDAESEVTRTPSPARSETALVHDEPSQHEEAESAPPEPYIHKDVHVNPKMTPVDARRPRSADCPPMEPYDGAPLVSVSGEYRPTTEDIVLSMLQETTFIVPRHGTHIANAEQHRTGEKSSVWKTRIST